MAQRCPFLPEVLLLCFVLFGALTPSAAAPDGNEDASSSRYTIDRIPKDMKVQDNIVYKTVGGRQLKLVMFLPPVKKFEKAPLLVYIHGGGWGHGNRFIIVKSGGIDVVRQLNAAGVICVSIEYRLVDGSGPTAMDAVADSKDAIHFLVENAKTYGIDPDRIATMGGSAGGHLSLVTALGEDNDYPCDPALARFKGKIVAEVAYFPLISMVDPAMFKGSNFERPIRLNPILGGPIEQKLDVAKKLSPALLLKPTSPPIFLAQGNQDQVLNVINSITMAKLCEQKGVPHELIIVKNAGHGFSGTNPDPSVSEISKRTSAFLLKYLLPGAK
jgi:acetyl esterase/lipase